MDDRVELPAELLGELRNAALDAVFSRLPPSHQREFINWIESAKKPETRKARIEKTVTAVRERA